MAVFGNFKGTTQPSFKLGKHGKTIHGGSATPTTPVAGDIWLDSANTALKKYDGSSWTAYLSTNNLVQGNIFLGNASNQAQTANLDTVISALGYAKTNNSTITLQQVTNNGNTTTDTIFATTSGQHEGNVASRDGSVNVLNVGTQADGSDAFIIADVTGDVVGDVVGDVTGDVLGNLTGNVTGEVNGNVNTRNGTTTVLDVGASNDGTDAVLTADVTGDVTSSGTSTFSGTIDAVNGAIMGNIDGDVRTRTGSNKIVDVGINGDGTDSEINIHDINVTGTLSSDDITSSTISISGDMLVTGDTVMTGNLTVNGETTIINSNTITSGDALIVLNADLPSGQAPSLDSGLEINRGSSANVQILWVEGSDYFELRDVNSVKQDLVIGNLTSTGIDDNATSTKLTVADTAITTGSIDQLIVSHSTDGGGIRIDSTNSTNTGSLRFGDDLDNYIGALEYNHTSNAMSMYVNNATRMTINSSGDVGIGTGSGAVLAPLHVDGSSATGVAGYLRLQNETANTGYTGVYFSVDPTYAKQAIYAQRQYPNGGGSLIFAVDSATDAADVAISDEKMRIDAAGNVGIGTSSPDSLLHVDGAIQAKSSIETYQALTGTSVSIDCSAASVFSLSTTGATTFSFTNVPSITNTALRLTLEVTAGGTHTLTWPASVKWAGGTAPDAPASGETNIYDFYTRDAGTTWYSFLSGAAMA